MALRWGAHLIDRDWCAPGQRNSTDENVVLPPLWKAPRNRTLEFLVALQADGTGMDLIQVGGKAGGYTWLQRLRSRVAGTRIGIWDAVLHELPQIPSRSLRACLRR